MGSGFSEFFQQIPFGFLAVTLGSFILLVIAVTLILYTRRQRSADRRARAGVTDEAQALDGSSSTFDLPTFDDFSDTGIVVAGGAGLRFADGSSVEAVEVFAVYRSADGDLIVRIGETAYTPPLKDADPAVRRRYANALMALVTADTPTSSAPPPAPPLSPLPSSKPPPPEPPAFTPEPPRLTPLPPTPPAPPAPPSDVGNDDEPTFDDLPGVDDLTLPPAPPPSARLTATMTPNSVIPPNAAMPGDLPRFSVPDNPQPLPRGRRPKFDPIPEINIGASIEAFLQHKLKTTGVFPNRRIHVRSSGAGIQIEVDGRFFDGVNDIDDSDVRAFLQQTIQEWQDRQ